MTLKQIKKYLIDSLVTSMTRREKISFIAEKKISKPVRVEFYNKEGEKDESDSERNETLNDIMEQIKSLSQSKENLIKEQSKII